MSILSEIGGFIFAKVFGDDDGSGQMPSASEQQLALATRALERASIFKGARIGPKTTRFESSQAKLFELPGFEEKMKELLNLMGTDDLAKRQLSFALQEMRPGITSASKIGLERSSSPSARGPTIRI